MKNRTAYLGIVFLTILLHGCENLFAPGFSTRDAFVVTTPAEYPENKVAFLSGNINPDKSNVIDPRFKKLVYPFEMQPCGTNDTHCTSCKFSHGDPLSVIVSSAFLPKFKKKSEKVRDIALILDISAQNSGENRSIVVWYQKNVIPGQVLNFGSLLVYAQPTWDEKVAPLIRLRMMDVANEKNIETRANLSRINQNIGALSSLVGAGGQSQLLNIAATTAAQLLSNSSNQMILDFSIQFYGEALNESAGDSNLAPLKKGRFILIGRTKEETGTDWPTLFFDDKNSYLTASNSENNINFSLNTPYITVSASNADPLLPRFVLEKSEYLSKLLQESQQRDLTEIQISSKQLASGIEGYVLSERLRRLRDLSVIDEIGEFIKKPDTPADAKAALLRTLRQVSQCPYLKEDDISKLADINPRFIGDAFQLEWDGMEAGKCNLEDNSSDDKN